MLATLNFVFDRSEAADPADRSDEEQERDMNSVDRVNR
jgi:hypothetical protein